MKKVLLLLAEGFEFYEASVFIDVFGWNLLEGNGLTKLYSCAAKGTVKSSFDQLIIVDLLIQDVNDSEFDALAIPGGFEEFGFYDSSFAPAFLEVIKRFDRANKPIYSICTGALPIAKSGALNNRRATTYRRGEKRRNSLRSMNVEVIDSAIVTDGNITTSFDPSTAVEVAFKLLTQLTDVENGKRVKELMGFG